MNTRQKLLLMMGKKAAAVAGPPTVVSDGLVLEWRFDEGTGQTLTDYTANAYNGTLGANSGAAGDDPTWAGGGLTFSGTQFVQAAGVPDSVFLGANGYTAIILTKITSLPNNYVQFMSDDTGADAIKIPIEWRTYPSETPLVQYVAKAGDVVTKAWRGAPITFNDWCVYGVTSPQAMETAPYFWANGRRYYPTVGSGTGTGNATGRSHPLRIGNREDGFVKLAGISAYALVYNRQLTQTEMEQNYLYIRYKVASRSIVLNPFGVGVVCDGDSISTGYLTSDPSKTYPRVMEVSLGSGYDVWNIGIIGASINDDHHAEVALSFARSKNIYICQAGGNDIDGGISAATVYSKILLKLAAMKTAGFTQVIVGTTLDRTSFDASQRTEYHTLNTSIKNGAGANGYTVADFDGDARLQDFNNGTYFNADKVHLTDAGYAVMASIATTAVQAV